MRPIDRLLNSATDEGTRREFLELTVQYDTPAFIRRANRTAEAAEDVFREAGKQRVELLEIARTRLAMLAALLDNDWQQLEPIVQPATPVAEQPQLGVHDWLGQLQKEWQPELRGNTVATTSLPKLRRAVKDLAQSFTRFNQRWQSYVEKYNLDHVNQLRRDYNNYYVVEKACAFDSERIGQQGFVELKPMTVSELLERYPPLHVPSVR